MFVLAVTVWLLANEHRLVYFTVRALDATPAAVGWRFEDVTLRTEDGVALHAWFVPGESAFTSARDVARRMYPMLRLRGGPGAPLRQPLEGGDLLGSLDRGAVLIAFQSTSIGVS